MKRTILAAVVLGSLTVLPTVVVVGAAQAATGTPVLVSPVPSGTVAYGWDGSMSVDFSGVAPGVFDVAVTPADQVSNDYVGSASGNENSDTQNFTVTAPTQPGSYCVSGNVTPPDPNAPNWSGSLGCFTVAEPALTVGGVSQRYAAFYPTVHDGYKDSTAITFSLNVHASVLMTVRNSAGATVFTHNYGVQAPGQHTLPWSGKTTSRVMLKPGSYVLGLTLTGASRTIQVNRPLAIKTGWTTWSVTQGQDGSAGHYSASGGCTVSDDADGYAADLDCWGSGSAQVTYGMAIPANATNIHASVRGHRTSGADICCNGAIKTWAGRANTKWVSFGVRIDGWRAFTLTDFALSYEYQARI